MEAYESEALYHLGAQVAELERRLFFEKAKAAQLNNPLFLEELFYKLTSYPKNLRRICIRKV